MDQHDQRAGRRRLGALLLSALLTAALLSTAGAAAAQIPAAARVSAYPEKLIPVGHAVGLKLFAEGVLVVGLAEVETDQGTRAPAKECGLRVGDMILQVDGTEIDSTEQFQELIGASGGEPLRLQVRRGEDEVTLTAGAVEAADGAVRLGAWVRDSLAGIGTMTFYDPVSGVFGTLGHGINDTDTSLLLPLQAGAVMYATVKAVKPGEAGEPGELRGDFCLTEDLGPLYANTDRGVFGTMDACSLVSGRSAVEVAGADEVRSGDAAILANVAGDTVEAYSVELEQVGDLSDPSRNFVLRVTDPRLLETTGGIVQGMSGSPILQDGKLIGAVTHVMVNDPQRGYGIFIGNMLKDAYSIRPEATA